MPEFSFLNFHQRAIARQRRAIWITDSQVDRRDRGFDHAAVIRRHSERGNRELAFRRIGASALVVVRPDRDVHQFAGRGRERIRSLVDHHPVDIARERARADAHLVIRDLIGMRAGVPHRSDTRRLPARQRREQDEQ